MEDLWLFFVGAGFFSSSFLIFRKTLTIFARDLLTAADITTISVKLVSTIQAAISVTVGWIIAGKCQKDIMHDSYWLTNTYAWFGMPYFYYDTVGMYIEHWHKHPEIQNKRRLYSVRHYIVNNKAMILHHVFLPTFFFPLIIFYRRGMGDFFVGTFYQIELSVPFLAFRNILVQLQMKNTVLYVVAGIALIIVFTLTRVLVFPYLYWCYALHVKAPLWKVPFIIPLKCNIGCLMILGLQIYWLYKMIKTAARLIIKLTRDIRQCRIT